MKGESLYWPEADFKQRAVKGVRRGGRKERVGQVSEQTEAVKAAEMWDGVPVVQAQVSCWQQSVNRHQCLKAVTLFKRYYVSKLKPPSTRACTWTLS